MDVTSYMLGKKNGGTTPTGTINIDENGTYDVTNYATANVDVGEVTYEDNDVNFYDYDGTIVYSCSAEDFASMTEMPSNPTHEGLTAEGWNWSLQNAKTYVAEYGMLEIGQTYHTTDGKIHLYIDVPSDNYSLYVGLNASKRTTIEWGDNTQDSSVQTSSSGNPTYTQHTYTTKGKYVIKLSSEGTFNIKGLGTDHRCALFSNKDGAPDPKCLQANLPYKIELSQNVKLENYALYKLEKLKTIVVPKDIEISKYAFSCLYNLVHLNLYSTTQLSDYLFLDDTGLKSLSLGDYAIDTIGSNVIWNTLLKKITFKYTGTTLGGQLSHTQFKEFVIPNSVTTLSSSPGSDNKWTKKIIFSKNLTDLSSSGWAVDYVDLWDFRKCTSIPTTGTATLGTNKISTIVVPDNLYNTWITSGNWTDNNYQGRIISASDYQE